MRKPIYFILAGTLWLSSCGIYKKYERPENINTTNIFRDTAVVNSALVTTDTTSLGSTPWREVFTDPYLRQLIDSALVNNTDMRSAALSVKQAKAMLTAAKLSYLPSFTFAPTGTLRSWDFGKASQIYSLPV
jgi:outer membrane protein TolC